MKISKSFLFTSFTFIIGFLIPTMGFLFPETFFSNQQKISQFVHGFGVWAPLIFVGLSIIPVIVTPLNHGIFGIVGGFIFGPWVGFFLNWISKMVGTSISFLIGRFFGKRAVKRYATSKNFEYYNKTFNQQIFLIFVGFTINDTLAYMAGFSTMKTKTFFVLAVFAHIIPAITLSYIGSGISLHDPLFFVLISSIFLLAFLYFLIKRKNN